MTSFVHVQQPTEHPGVNRAAAAYEQFVSARHRFDGARGLAALLLAAMVSALLVVADRLISTWSDGGLVAAWVALWAVAFVVLALFAGSTRQVAARVTATLRAGERRRRSARQDAQLWRVAQTDRRVMADIEAAISRASDSDSAAAATLSRRLPSLHEATRRDRIARFY